jgi:hypothetical protein
VECTNRRVVLHLIHNPLPLNLNLLQNRPLRSPRSRIILPDALTAEVGVAIVTKFNAGGQVFEQFRVTASEHDVINDKSAL